VQVLQPHHLIDSEHMGHSKCWKMIEDWDLILKWKVEEGRVEWKWWDVFKNAKWYWNEHVLKVIPIWNMIIMYVIVLMCIVNSKGFFKYLSQLGFVTGLIDLEGWPGFKLGCSIYSCIYLGWPEKKTGHLESLWQEIRIMWGSLLQKAWKWRKR
jgi:hypothetical protein